MVERVQGGQRSWVHTRGCGGEQLTSHSLTMLSWGALLGGYAQDGRTPLYMACYEGHMEVVKLLLAHSDVNVNTVNQVRRRGGAGREREGMEELGAHQRAAVEGGSPHTH